MNYRQLVDPTGSPPAKEAASTMRRQLAITFSKGAIYAVWDNVRRGFLQSLVAAAARLATGPDSADRGSRPRRSRRRIAGAATIAAAGGGIAGFRGWRRRGAEFGIPPRPGVAHRSPAATPHHHRPRTRLRRRRAA